MEKDTQNRGAHYRRKIWLDSCCELLWNKLLWKMVKPEKKKKKILIQKDCETREEEENPNPERLWNQRRRKS